MNRWSSRINRLKFKTSTRKITDQFRVICGICPRIIQQKLKARNMEPVGLGNTTVVFSPIMPKNLPRTLPGTTPMEKENQLLVTDEPVEFEEYNRLKFKT
jgi:hypothetical protein